MIKWLVMTIIGIVLLLYAAEAGVRIYQRLRRCPKVSKASQ